jgi:fructose-bisphosphate aldolase class I
MDDSQNNLQEIIKKIFSPKKGILALDWSPKTIEKQFEKVGLTSTPELNRIYRQMLLTTPGIEEYVGGVILHDETVSQVLDVGEGFTGFLTNTGIVPGVRADQGSSKYEDTDQDMTEGLGGLKDRLEKYFDMGIRFSKWRAGFKISDLYPSKSFMEESAARLTEFAKLSHEVGMVPLVEPDVEMTGRHTTTRCSEISVEVLQILFNSLKQGSVDLSKIILKTNMILPGKESGVDAAPFEIAQFTHRALKKTVPPEVPGIVFLSGGQTPDQATANLNEIMKQKGDAPWDLSFSFARALQEEALKTWAGLPENMPLSQDIFIKRLELVSKARQGLLE